MGPTMMRWVYHYTKDGAWMGPGSMFLVAASLYTIAVYCSYLLPVRIFNILFFLVMFLFICTYY